MKNPKRLLLPTTLVIAGGRSCFDGCEGPCGSQPGDACLPDGNYLCHDASPGCRLVNHTEDGGIFFNADGGVDCLC
jgi:hypothetical protein